MVFSAKNPPPSCWSVGAFLAATEPNSLNPLLRRKLVLVQGYTMKAAAELLQWYRGLLQAIDAHLIRF